MVELLLKKWYKYEPELVKKPTRNNPKPLQKKPSSASKLRLQLIQKHIATESSTEDSIESTIQREYLKYIAISDVVVDPLL